MAMQMKNALLPVAAYPLVDLLALRPRDGQVAAIGPQEVIVIRRRHRNAKGVNRFDEGEVLLRQRADTRLQPRAKIAARRLQNFRDALRHDRPLREVIGGEIRT